MATTKDVQLGQLVISKTGRDKARSYLIAKILDDSFVSLVDGDLRKVTNPKRKNIKHLQATDKIATELMERLQTGKKVENEKIRQVIQELMR